MRLNDAALWLLILASPARLPDFLFIGPDKSGSSWIHYVLQQHHECYVPSFKDIYFFDRYYDKGLDWYQNFFEDCPLNAKAVGELSHDYLFSHKAANRIAQSLPDVKLITSLRHPAERCFSHYLYLKRNGATTLSFEEALTAFPELISNSHYYAHLKKYVQLFKREQLQILLFDDLTTNPELFAEKLLSFLNIDTDTTDISLHETIRPASQARSNSIARLGKWTANRLRDLGFPNHVGTLKNSSFANYFYKPYDRNSMPQMNANTRLGLCKEFYNDIDQLEKLINVDLTGWKK